VHDFRKKSSEHKMCVLITSTFVWNISHSKNNWARYYHKRTHLFMQSTRYSCRTLMKVEFSVNFSKNSQISNFMKISPVGAELFHTDRRTNGRTGMWKLIVALRNFTNAPKKNKDLRATNNAQ
jgi:hypothetical protein